MRLDPNNPRQPRPDETGGPHEEEGRGAQSPRLESRT